MSLEGKTKEDYLYNPKAGFLGNLKNLGGYILKDAEEIPVIGGAVEGVADAISGTWNFITGDSKQKTKIGNELDLATGGYGEYFKGVFGSVDESGYKKMRLDDDEKDILNTLSSIEKQNDTSMLKKVYEISGLQGLLGREEKYSEQSFIKGNQEELLKKLDEIDTEAVTDAVIEENKKEYESLGKKIQAETENLLNERIKLEIGSLKLANNAESINRRKGELTEEYQRMASNKYAQEIENFNQKFEAKFNEVADPIYKEYVKPVGNYNARQTFELGLGGNRDKDLEYILRNKIDKEFLEDFDAANWNLSNTYNKDGYFKIEEKAKEDRLRDLKNYYDMLSVAQTDEQRENIKALLLPQMKAREFLLNQQLKEARNLLASTAPGEKADLVDIGYKAFDLAYDKLSKTDKKELLKRDGTDLAAAHLHDNMEFEKRTKQLLSGAKNLDFSDMVVGAGGMFANTIQQLILHPMGAFYGGGAGILSSLTGFKSDDKERIFKDEYELATANSSLMSKGVKHIYYNFDDIGEALYSMAKGGQINVVGRKLEELNKSINALKKVKVGNGLLKLDFTKRTGEAVTTGLKIVNYGAIGLTDSFVMSPMVDRHLRTVDTDINSALNSTLDIFFEPVTHYIGKTKAAQTAISHIKYNPISDLGLKFVKGEIGKDEAIRMLMSKMKEQGEEISRSDATKVLEYQNQFLWNQAGQTMGQIYKDPEMLVDVMQRGYNVLKDTIAHGNEDLLDSGLLVSLDSIYKYKKTADNQIADGFNMMKSDDAATQALGKAKIETLTKRIPDIIEGKLYGTGEVRIKLDKNEKDKQLDLFKKRLEKIEKEVDLDKRKDLLKDTYGELIKLSTSSLNKSKERLEQTIIIRDLIGNQEFAIKVKDLDLLKKKDPEAIKDLYDKNIITVTDKNRDYLKTKEVKVETETGKTGNKSLVNKSSKVNSSLNRVLQSLITGKVKGRKGLGWSSTGENYYNMSNIEDFKRDIRVVFGEDNVDFVEIPQFKEGDKLHSREEILGLMHKGEGKLTFGYGVFKPKKGEPSFNIYVGLGKKLLTGDGLKFDVKGLNVEKEGKIIRDILTLDTVDAGVKFAFPNNNIATIKGLTDTEMGTFIARAFFELQKDGEYIKKGLKGTQFTKLGNNLFKAIKENFKHIATENSTYDKWLFEVFALKYIENADLYSTIFNNIKKYKQGEIGEEALIKTLDDLDKLIKSFTGDLTLSRGSEEFKNQFTMKNYRKLAKEKYEIYRENRLARKAELEEGILISKDTLVSADYKEFHENNIRNMEQYLEDIENDLKITEKDYINRTVDVLFHDSFEMYTYTTLLNKFHLDEIKKPPLKQYIETEEPKKIIQNKTKELEETDTFKIEEYKKDLEKYKRELQTLDKNESIILDTTVKNKPAVMDKNTKLLDDLRIKREEINKNISDIKLELKDLLDKRKANPKLSKKDTNRYNEIKKEISRQEEKLDRIKSYLEQQLELFDDKVEFSDDFIKDFKAMQQANSQDGFFTISELQKFLDKHKDEINTQGKAEYVLDRISQFQNAGKQVGTDFIQFIGRDLINSQTMSYLDNERSFEEALIENPIVKFYSTALTGAKNNESDIGLNLLFRIIEDMGGDELYREMDDYSLQSLYRSSDKFREFVQGLEIRYEKTNTNFREDTLYKTVEKYSMQNITRFKHFINKYLDDIDLSYVDKNGKKHTLDAFKTDEMYEVLYKRFKELNYNTHRAKGLVVKKNSKGYKQGYVRETFDTKSILTQRLEEKIKGFSTYKISGIDNLKYIDIGVETKEGKFGLYDVALKGSKHISNQDDALKIADKLDYYDDTSLYKDIKAVFNGTSKSSKLMNRDVISKSLDIPYEQEIDGVKHYTYMMGTYGDNDSQLLLYTTTIDNYKAAQIDFQEKFIKESGFGDIQIEGVEGDFRYNTTDIGKRVSSMGSYKPIFEKVNFPVNNYIIQEKQPIENLKAKTLMDDLASGKKELSRDNMNELYLYLKEDDKYFDENVESFAKMSYEDQLDIIKKTYFTDMEDGFSATSSYIGNLYSLITKGKTSEEAKAIKVHLTGIVEKATDDVEMFNNLRHFTKSLFNVGVVRGADWSEINNIVLSGESSVKLGLELKKGIKKGEEGLQADKHKLYTEFKDLSKDEKKKFVKEGDNIDEATEGVTYVDGIAHVIIGKREGVELQHMVNAKSEEKGFSDTKTISKQILNLLDYHITDEISEEIYKELFDETTESFKGLGMYDKKTNIYGVELEALQKISRVFSGGSATDSMITAQLNTILSNVKRNIDKYEIKASLPTVKCSMIKLPNGDTLKRNQVIISKSGKNHKIIVGALKEEKAKLEQFLKDNGVDGAGIGKPIRTSNPALTKQIKESIVQLRFIENQLASRKYYVTSFRNPVPTKENMGVHEVILAEDVGLNSPTSKSITIYDKKTGEAKRVTRPKGNFVKGNDVISHPESVFVKQEGDFDGDTNVIVPLHNRVSMALARGALQLGKEVDNMGLLKLLKSGEFSNKIINVKQVDDLEATLTDAEKKIEHALDLVSDNNLEAKRTISLVFSVVKVSQIFRQEMTRLADGDKSVLKTKIKINNFKKKGGYEIVTFKDILDELLKLTGKEKYGELFTYGDEFGSSIGSLSQMVLDFAKSKAIKFPKEDWIKRIMNGMGLDDKAHSYFYTRVLSRMARDNGNIIKNLNKKSSKKIFDSRYNEDFLSEGFGYQRKLLERFIKDFGDKIVSLNDRQLFNYAFRGYQTSLKEAGINISTFDEDLKVLISNGYRSEDFNKAMITKVINYSDQLSKGNNKTLAKTGEKIKEDIITIEEMYKEGEEDITKIIKEIGLFDSKGNYTTDKLHRMLLSMYLMGKGDSRLANLFNDRDLMGYINQSALNKYNKIKAINQEYQPSFILEGQIDTTGEFKRRFKENVDSLEAKINKKRIELEQLESKKAGIENKTGNKIQDLKNAIEDLELQAKELDNRIIEIDNDKTIIDQNIEEIYDREVALSLDNDIDMYINTDTGEYYDRVSNYVGQKLDESEIEDKELFYKSGEAGKEVQTIIGDFFSGKELDITKYKQIRNEGMVNDFIEELKILKKQFDDRGETIYTKSLTIYDDKSGLAGTINMITRNAEGKYTLYDIKTIIADTPEKYANKELGAAVSKADQLNLYRILLNNSYGIKVDNLKVLPIEASFDYSESGSIIDVASIQLHDEVTIGKQDIVDNFRDENKIKLLKAKIKTIEKAIKTLEEGDKQIATGIKEIDETINKPAGNLLAMADFIDTNLGSVELELKQLDDLLEENKKFLDILDVKKEEIIKPVESLSKDKESYIDNISIKYQYQGVELDGLKANVEKVSNIYNIMREGYKLTLEYELSSVSESEIQVMNAARSLHGPQGQNMKSVHTAAVIDLRNKLMETGLRGAELEEALKIFDYHAYDSIIYSGDRYIFNKEAFEENIKKGKHSTEKVVSTGEDGGFEKLFTEEQQEILENNQVGFLSVYQSIVDGFNKLDRRYADQGGFSIDKYDSGLRTSFVTDAIGSFTGDLQFEFRRKGIVSGSDNLSRSNSKKNFIKYLKKQASFNPDIKFSEARAGKLYDFIYTREDGWMTKIVKNYQALHYFANYQLGSLLFGGTGHLAAMTQVLGNGLEVLSYLSHGDYLEDGDKLVKQLGLMGEDTLSQGSGARERLDGTAINRGQKFVADRIHIAVSSVIDKQIEKNLSKTRSQLEKDGKYSKAEIEKILKKQKEEIKMINNKISNGIDAFINEPLLAVDVINDAARRRAAIQHVMKSMGMDREEELIAYVSASNINRSRFETLFYRKYNEIGGGVISTSNIYRETFLTTWEHPAASFFATMYRYLLGWGFHKLSTGSEKILGLVQAVKELRRGNIDEAQLLLNEFITYAAIQMTNIGLAAGIAGKIEKYDYSDDDKDVSNKELVYNMTNNLTVLDMLFGKQKDAWASAEGGSIDTKAGMVLLGMLENMTRVFKLNPKAIYNTAQQRQDILGEDAMNSYYNASKQLIGGYLRSTRGLELGNIYEEVGGQDNASILMYGSMSKMSERGFEASKEKRAALMETVGFWGVLGDTVLNYFDSEYIGNDVLRKVSGDLLKDEEIQKIYDGIGGTGYNLDNLLMTDGQLDMHYVNNLYQDLVSYDWSDYDRYDEKGRKILPGKELHNKRNDEIITNFLNELGYDKHDFVNHPKTLNEGLAKLMIAVDQKQLPEISTKYLTSWIGRQMEYNIKEKIKEPKKGLRYTDELSDKELDLAKYLTLKKLESSGLLDLNLENHQDILGYHIKKNYGDLVDTISKANVDYALLDYMKTMVVSHENLKDGDTNAKYLNTVYSRGLKGAATLYSRGLKGAATLYSGGERIEPNAKSLEMLTDTALKTMSVIYNSTQPGKERNAKLASALMGLNDAGWDLLKDNEKFKLLSKPAQKQLISWMYRTNDELLSYDSDEIINYMDRNTFGGKKKGYSSFFRKGNKSGYGSGARPGFSNQYPQLRDFIKGKDVPENYSRIANDYSPKQRFTFDYTNFPIVKALMQRRVQEMYRDIISGGKPQMLIKTKKAVPQGGYVKGKRPTKQKLKKIGKPKMTQPIYHRRTTVPSLPGDIANKIL